MSPHRGSIHRRARSDSGAARLWHWARERRGPWTTLDAAEACAISARRCRAMVCAMHEAGMLDQTSETEVSGAGQVAAEWSLSAAGRALDAAPVMMVVRGSIVGARAATSD